MLIEAQSDNGTRIYFQSHAIEAFGVHQANKLWSWVQIGKELYNLHTPIDYILKQFPDDRLVERR